MSKKNLDSQSEIENHNSTTMLNATIDSRVTESAFLDEGALVISPKAVRTSSKKLEMQELGSPPRWSKKPSMISRKESEINKSPQRRSREEARGSPQSSYDSDCQSGIDQISNESMRSVSHRRQRDDDSVVSQLEGEPITFDMFELQLGKKQDDEERKTDRNQPSIHEMPEQHIASVAREGSDKHQSSEEQQEGNRNEVAQQKPQERKVRALKVVRMVYFVLLLYTGFVFPVMSSLRHYLVTGVEIGANFLQLAYVGLKLWGKKEQKLADNLRSYFGSLECVQLLGLLPFEIWTTQFYQVLYFLKLLRLVTFTKQFRKIFSPWLSKKQISFWNIILILQIISLWKANLWIFFSKSSYSEQSWINLYCFSYEPEELSGAACFLKAYYLLLYTSITIGYGDIPPVIFRQRILMLYFMVDGLLVFSYCVAGISNYLEEKLMTKTDKQRAEFYLGQLRKDMGQHFDGLTKAYQYLARQGHVDMENEQNFQIVKELSEGIQGEISNHLNKKVFGNITFFQHFPLIKLIDLLPFMVELHYAKDQLITKQGIPGEDLYLLRSGEAGGLMPSAYRFKKPICFLRFGEKSSFGEYQVFPYSRPHRFSVVTLQYCRVLVVSAYELLPMFKKNQYGYQELLEYSALKGRYMLQSQRQAARRYAQNEGEQHDNNNFDIQVHNDEYDEPTQNRAQDFNLESKLREMDPHYLQKLLQSVQKCQKLLQEGISPYSDDHQPQ